MAATRLTASIEERTQLAGARLGECVLEKWRLESLIGMGGMAAVFEASQRNGNRVAIKILHADLASCDEIRERFLTEGYAANRVAHPGVVTVRDEGTTNDGAVFLVMDLLRGQTLAQRLAAGREPFSVSEVLEISSQLLDVLVHAHGRGIVHRDLKPENVFLTHERRVRLLDFGVARVEAATHKHATPAGTTLGTPAFMSPEQALGHSAELDGRSDLWSLGATMYLLLSGQPAREPGSSVEQLLGAMTRPVPSLGESAVLPRSVVAVVDRALAFDREDRFPDARSMQLAVRAILDELCAPDSRATLPPASLEPVAISLRTPRPEARDQRASTPTVRPVVSTAGTSPTPSQAPWGALPAYVSFGIAVGLGIVLAARLTLRAPAATSAAQPERSGGSTPGPPAVILPAPAQVSSSASAAALESMLPRPKQAPKQAASHLLSRRK